MLLLNEGMGGNMPDKIVLTNARENNLKNISLEIPKNKISIFTGVSGSGKSSIVFDTIAQESGRQMNETYTGIVRTFLPKYKRPDIDDITGISPVIIVNQKPMGGNARSTMGTTTDINSLFRILFSRVGHPHIGDYANQFSFNDPQGMCLTCEGLGRIITLNIDAAFDKTKSLNEGPFIYPGYKVDSMQWRMFAESGFFDNDKALEDYTDEEWHQFLYGEATRVEITYKKSKLEVTYEGFVTHFIRTQVKTDKEQTKTSAKIMEDFSIAEECPDCHGARYNDDVLSSKIDGYSIFDLTDMELDDLVEVLSKLSVPETAKGLIDGILGRANNLINIGLGYMNLTRETSSLSGGESQRVKMMKNLSSSLTDMVYIFDEPSTGLHPKDVHRLNELLRQIRDNGNTVLVVEHDPDVIKIADYIVDVGPKAGVHGGNVMYTGDYAGLLKSDTLTGRFLDNAMPFKEKPRAITTTIKTKTSHLHNLKDVALELPEHVLTVLTGVAGSGKSSLIQGVFLQEHPEAIYIDQKSIHTNSRSNPATYMDLMTPIRKLFATENDVDNGYFSYNSKGACTECNGTGKLQLNMSYMDQNDIECPRCHGTRFEDFVLQYTYKNKNIVEVMDMTVESALDYFEAKPILKKIQQLVDVGLGYLSLGQGLDTLSGGEAQRLKLAKELSGKNGIYVLDEPTTGLHMSDISLILEILNRLVDNGNTVVIIEHNVDVIRQADWMIDMGPTGGKAGGQIIYTGTPEGSVTDPNSVTGKYL